MTMTRAWWIAAFGMIVAVPGTIAVAVINYVTDLGPDVHHALRYLAQAVLVLGLVIAAVGVVQVTRVAVRAIAR
jgi:hypothetical protein